jgi:hypothetical protein
MLVTPVWEQLLDEPYAGKIATEWHPTPGYPFCSFSARFLACLCLLDGGSKLA